MDTLSLFDLGMPEVEEKKKEDKKAKAPKSSSPKAKAASSSTTPKPPVKPKPEVKVTGEWSIHFATDSFTVSDFVTDIPEEGVTLEEVRVEMEKNFAQFSAARTKWDVVEDKKQLFPDASAGSKGGHSLIRGPLLVSLEEAEQHTGNVSFVPGQDGKLYEVRKSIFGQMIAPAQSISHFDQISPGFSFSLPKIPSDMLGQILSFFQAFTLKGKFEVMVKVYWDKETSEYVIACPKQTVTGIHIDYGPVEAYTGKNNLRYVPVLDIHSHNVMRAFFSEVDNIDEQQFGLYGVVGRLNQNTPEILMRAKSGKSEILVPASMIFDMNLSDVKKGYPAEWDNQVIVKGCLV